MKPRMIDYNPLEENAKQIELKNEVVKIEFGTHFFLIEIARDGNGILISKGGKRDRISIEPHTSNCIELR